MSSCGHKIKVVCRVRPFLKSEKPDESVEVEPNNVLRVTNPRDTTKDIKFNFDACYGPDIKQEVIYKNDVKPLVETIFNGMSATVFCYGVTGAGKTHTIQGTEAEPGIIPRALEHIFKHQERDAYDYDIRISYYEIYKEAVYDLLRPRDSVTALPIREDAQRKIFVAGLSEKKVTSYEQFDSLYQRACGNRRTASTKLNNHSSRSHAILTVQVQWEDDLNTGKTWEGRLHLIDLAGSEDNRRTDNSGKDRMAESSAINRSLFVLGQVVEALNNGSSRIPYRDSKMTRILQDSLGGESLGMMIVNVAPGESFLQDTHNTLNFATKSREVVNKPVAHEVVEQRWTVGDRLQHHRSTGRHTRPGMVVAAATSSNGVKRRRSDEGGAASEEEGSPGYDERTSSGQRPAARRRISPATSATKYSDHSNAASSAQSSLPRLTQASGRRAAPEQADLVNKVVSAKFHEIEQKTESTSNEIMERVMRIEKQLNDKQLDSNAIIDLFTPATKLKTSRGWLKYARELEQKGDLEKALVHYEEALRYAPELNKLESHIAKLKARIRKVKRRSSIASHGSANVKVASKPDNKAMGATLGLPINGGGGVGDGVDDDDDDDAGPLWMVDGLAESPGAEKAKRRIKSQASGTRPKQPPNLQTQKPLVFNKTVAPAPAPAPAAPVPAPAAGAKTQSKRVKLGADAVNGKRKLSATAGSVHDRRVSFGGSSLNPFVVGGDDFNSELQQRLERKVPVTGTLKTRKLEAKSSAVARLRRTLQAPATPEDRSDKDFVLHSDGSDSDNAREEEELLQQLSNKSSNGAKARRAGRVPGSLGVRGLLVERRKAEEEVKSKLAPSQSKENLPTPSAAANGGGPKPKKAAPSGSSAAAEENLALDQFNDICLASALQMVNSGDVKKIMKLQGIGKRRAEQIQESVQTRGPISHIAELQDRLQFKNKIIVGILSTFA